jgi:hypothetical protein
MKFFKSNNKFNFVDENNVLLGYDSEEKCCERAGYFISETETIPAKMSQVTTLYEQIENNPINLEGFKFDTNFFKQEYSIFLEDMSEDGDVDFGYAMFKIKNDSTGKELFIIIYNAQNGYYSHGFTFGVGNEIFKSDML